MERLDLLNVPENSTVEASIHLARYASIVPFVQGKRVLDVACGEGYGSALLKLAGAEKVVGIDVSADAIDKARAAFSTSKAEYITADVAQLQTLFEPGSFDIIVSIETIEHVHDYQRFLESLVAVARQDAIFYLTCPNDHWYYPKPEQKNPYHVRKFTFEEFTQTSTAILGTNVQWGLGAPILGFGTVPLSNAESPWERLCESWLTMRGAGSSYAVPNQEHSPVQITSCSFFTGMWNLPKDERPAGAAWFAISMDAYTRVYESLASDTYGELRQAIERAKQELIANEEKHRHLISDLERDLRHQSLRIAATQAENRAIRESLGATIVERDRLQMVVADLGAAAVERDRLQMLVTEMEPGYRRYKKISERIPRPLKTLFLATIRLFKRG